MRQSRKREVLRSGNTVTNNQTRLISIVSKPIKVVVVLIVVVFIKKDYVQKKFDPKVFHVQKL